MKKNRIIIVLFLILVVIITLLLCWIEKHRKSKFGNIDDVKVNIIQTNGHNKDDITKLIEVIKDSFFEECRDSKLLLIEYGKFSNTKQLEEEIKKEKKVDEVVQFTYKFMTGNFPSVGLVSNEEYEYYVYFGKKSNKWEILLEGQ